jgi:hypothetical protein
MRTARQLLLLTIIALVAMALTAPASQAQEAPIEVTNEVEHCDLAAANCEYHFVGNQYFALYIGGVFAQVISACNEEFLATIGEDGSGFVYAGDYHNNVSPSGPCTRIQCNDDGEADWPITGVGEYTGSQADEGHLSMRICVDNQSNPEGVGGHCTWETPIRNLGNHRYGFEADGVVCPIYPGYHVELNGVWGSEAVPDEGETDLELIH